MLHPSTGPLTTHCAQRPAVHPALQRYLRDIYSLIRIPVAAALCPDSKRGEDQLPALLVPAERGKALFIKERYLAGDMGVKNVRTSRVQKHSSVQAYK